jgi:protein TonB
LASAIPEALGEPAPEQPQPPASKPEPPEPVAAEKPAEEKTRPTPAREPVETREPPSPAGSDKPRGVTRQARSKVGIKPEYPRASVRRGHEGTVIVEADVSSRGTVLAARVVESSGHARLDAAAVEAVKQARFIPAMQDGQSVADTVRVPIRFRLKG